MHAQQERHATHGQSGLTLIETMISCLILTAVVLFMAQLFGVVVMMNKNNGSDATKAVALAEAKLEELAGLAFTDSTSNTTVDPPYPATGSGLTAGGSITTRTTKYCDFVDSSGAKIALPPDLSQTPASAAFVRQWQITNNSTTLKQINIAVTSVRSFQYGAPPAATLITLKAQ